jgi:hypothetical protein
LEHLGVHDAGVPPMTDAFDPSKRRWNFHATPAAVLYNSTLPLPPLEASLKNSIPKPTHDAAWWEARTKDFDFSREDRIDSGKFNRVIWQGLMGDKPYPTERSGADLRQNRQQLLKTVTPQSDSIGAVARAGGE